MKYIHVFHPAGVAARSKSAPGGFVMILDRAGKMRKVLFLLPEMLFVLLATTASASESIVQSVRFWNEADHIRIVFDLSAETTRNIFLLDQPDRVVVDLQNARIATRIKQPELSDPAFRGIRFARRNENDLRIVLDLKNKVLMKSFLSKSGAGSGHQLVLDLYDLETSKAKEKSFAGKAFGTPETINSEPGDATNARREYVLKNGSSHAGPAFPNPIVSKRPIDPVQTRSPPRITVASKPANEFVVAIDAGHGGNDPGAKGASGSREKDVVLSIAKKLVRLIAREPGMRAVLIRDGDYFIALRERMRVARAANADIFVSIHADAYNRSDMRGSSVYILSQKGASSEAARWLAAKQNESDRLGGVRLDDKDDMLAEVLLDLSQTATLDASADLANQVLGNLRQLGKVHKRTVQSAGFAVLKSPDIPSILVETAYISNPHEEKNLRNPNYQDQLAKAILTGIRKYYRERTVPALYMAARKHVIEPGETLSGIARRYGLSTRELQAANTLRSTQIKAGQVLEIPAGS